MNRCSVEDCERPVDSWRLCKKHYMRAQSVLRRQGRPFRTMTVADVPPMVVEAPLVCVCDHPSPDGLGECASCRRPVVTFLSIPNAAELWPTEYQRAVSLGAVPFVAREDGTGANAET